MAEPNTPVTFDSCMEGVLARFADQRFRIALQIVASSIDQSRLEKLQTNLDRLPADSPRKNAIDVAGLAAQLAAVVPQIVALDLDRTTPMRILGVGRATVPMLFSARCFGHNVALVGRVNFVTDLLLTLYGMSGPEAKTATELPEGTFDLIVCHGGLNLNTKQAWAAFALPLASRLAENGRLFVILVKQPHVRRKYYPDVVLSKLARMGARVSSKYSFVLLDAAVIRKFDAAAVESPSTGEIAAEPDPAPEKRDADKADPGAPQLPPEAGQPSVDTDAKPNWKIGAALIGSSVVLIGLLVANWTWAGH